MAMSVKLILVLLSSWTVQATEVEMVEINPDQYRLKKTKHLPLRELASVYQKNENSAMVDENENSDYLDDISGEKNGITPKY